MPSGDRDVEFQIKATDQSARATEAAADNFEHLGHAADKATRKIDDLGDETGQLARKLTEARASALALARQFDKTGDPKLLKDFEKINREAAKLGRVQKTIKFDDVEHKAKTVTDKIVKAFSALPVEVQGAIAGTALVVVGAFQGAVTAAVAAGGIGAGLILGAQDDRVKNAYAKLGTDIVGSLKADASGFTNVLLQAAPRLRGAFDREEPRIKRIFDNLSNVTGPILDNTINAVERLAPAIERASVAGGKILVSLSASLPTLTASIGDLLDTFSSSSSGAAVSLNLLVLTASGAIETFSQLNFVLGLVLAPLGKLGELAGITGDHVKHLGDIQRGAEGSAALTAEQYAMLGLGMQNTAVAAQALNDAFNRLYGAQMGVDQANLAVNVGMQNLRETIKGNKKTLDESTQAGTQNVQVILSQIQALEQKRQADIAAGNGTKEATDKANAAYAANVAALRAVLIQLGLTASEVDRLITAYQNIPKTITTVITTVYRQDGTPASGHSRDIPGQTSGIDGWSPARFAAAGRGAAFAQASAPGSGGYSPPVELHSEHSFTVELDGRPFRAMVRRTTSAAEKRTAWRAKVGRR